MAAPLGRLIATQRTQQPPQMASCWPTSAGRCAPSCLASPGGGRPASTLRPHGAAISSARFSAPRAAWTRPSGPASRLWKPPQGPARRRCRLQAPRMWAWARWPTSGTSSTRRSSMSPRASRYAGGSSTPRRWPPGWRRWRGSGRSPVIRLVPWKRWARPSWPRRARPACSTPSRRSGRGCCSPTAGPTRRVSSWSGCRPWPWRGQPHRGDRPRPRARPAALTPGRHPATTPGTPSGQVGR